MSFLWTHANLIGIVGNRLGRAQQIAFCDDGSGLLGVLLPSPFSPACVRLSCLSAIITMLCHSYSVCFTKHTALHPPRNGCAGPGGVVLSLRAPRAIFMTLLRILISSFDTCPLRNTLLPAMLCLIMTHGLSSVHLYFTRCASFFYPFSYALHFVREIQILLARRCSCRCINAFVCHSHYLPGVVVFEYPTCLSTTLA